MYTCKCCDYETHRYTNFQRHMDSKRHKKLALVSFELALVSPKLASESPKTIGCNYCGKEFKHKSSLSRHKKYACTKNKDEDLKEFVRLLNEQTKNNYVQINDNLQKQIGKLTNKLQIQNLQNNVMHNSNNTINYNIKLLNHNETDYSHLTETDYVKCIRDCNHCVKTLIEKVHFNDTKPENKNIYISNIKNSYVMLYKNDKWQLVNRKDQIDDLYDYNEVILDNWYHEYKAKYPEIIQSFERYLRNTEGDDHIINQVKEQILLLLYNNRMIEN